MTFPPMATSDEFATWTFETIIDSFANNSFFEAIAPIEQATPFEIELLKNFHDKSRFIWIVRDKNKKLYLFKKKPKKIKKEWNHNYCTSSDFLAIATFSHLFKMVSWYDDEPTRISSLIATSIDGNK